MIKGVSFDFDDVLYNLTKINLKYIKEQYGIELKPKQVTDWNYYKNSGFESILENVWNNPQKYLESELIDGAYEFYKEVENIYGKDNIQIITASFPNIINVKDQYIKDIFNNDCKIIHTHDKFLYTKDTILIDDSINNILKHVEVNKNPAILFSLDYGWNSDFKEDNEIIYRANSYNEALNVLDKFNNVELEIGR